MLVALSVGQLHEAQPVASGHQAHSFSVDRDRTVGESDVRGQVFLVKMDSHCYSCARLWTALVRLSPALPAPRKSSAGFNHWSPQYF